MIALPFAREAKLIQLGLLELSFLASCFCGHFVFVRGECSGYCKRKADFDCYTDAAAGGCCNSTARPAHMIYDGDKCEKLMCNNKWHWQCDGSCHEDSACQGAKRIDDGAAACSANNCVGGCLRDGRCEHHFMRDQERACLMSNPDAIWCPPCDIFLWKSCSAAVACYDWPLGCCSAEVGGCPAPPYEMRRARECKGCAYISKWQGRNHFHDFFAKCSLQHIVCRPCKRHRQRQRQQQQRDVCICLPGGHINWQGRNHFRDFFEK